MKESNAARKRKFVASLRRELGQETADAILKSLDKMVRARVRAIDIEATIVEELSKHMLKVNREIINPIVIDQIVIGPMMPPTKK